jgi:hypothetical protein
MSYDKFFQWDRRIRSSTHTAKPHFSVARRRRRRGKRAGEITTQRNAIAAQFRVVAATLRRPLGLMSICRSSIGTGIGVTCIRETGDLARMMGHVLAGERPSDPDDG